MKRASMQRSADGAVSEPILSVRNLSIEVPMARGITRLVDDFSFDVMPHEVFGIVGESGSGKSLTMLAVMGLLPPPLRIATGEIRLRGQNLVGLSFEEMRAVRGKSLAMIFQDPMTSLNPVLRIGTQIGEMIALHNRALSRTQLRARIVELLTLVGIPDPERRLRQFPNEFSGGMRQRVMIAMAMANEPDLLIADEPTTALDVTIQAQVLDVLATARGRTGAAMVLITHDLGLIAESAGRVAVMYGGRMMERAAVRDIFQRPRHPYTVGLIASLPRLERAHAGDLYSIPGQVPDPAQRPSGCVFHPRCDMQDGRPRCRDVLPEFRTIAPDHGAACHYSEETPDWVARAQPVTGEASAAGAHPAAEASALRVVDLAKDFKIRRQRGWGSDYLRAVSDVSFTLMRGRTLGLVGESGCGKSTLGRLVLRLIEPTKGAVLLANDNLITMKRLALRLVRRRLQVVFQDPYASLDPRMTIHEVIAEPLRINGCYAPARVIELLTQVGLSAEAAQRKPAQFSGGQRQRIAIARALALKPDVMVLDEAVSALDVSIQAQVINLLKGLQRQLGLAFLFISHDLSVVHHICDDVAVMYLGRLVEFGSRDQVFGAPQHPYTRALLSAIPSMEAALGTAKERIILRGDIPNPLSPPSGCAFRTRCPKAAELCAQVSPALEDRAGEGHRSACHYPGDTVVPEGSRVAGSAR